MVVHLYPRPIGLTLGGIAYCLDSDMTLWAFSRDGEWRLEPVYDSHPDMIPPSQGTSHVTEWSMEIVIALQEVAWDPDSLNITEWPTHDVGVPSTFNDTNFSTSTEPTYSVQANVVPASTGSSNADTAPTHPPTSPNTELLELDASPTSSADNQPSSPPALSNAPDQEEVDRWVTAVKLQRKISGARTPIPCPVCAKEHKLPSTLKRHLYAHFEIKPFRCEDCGARFGTPSNLQRHQRDICRPNTTANAGGIYVNVSAVESNVSPELRNVYNDPTSPDFRFWNVVIE